MQLKRPLLNTQPPKLGFVPLMKLTFVPVTRAPLLIVRSPPPGPFESRSTTFRSSISRHIPLWRYGGGSVQPQAAASRTPRSVHGASHGHSSASFAAHGEGTLPPWSSQAVITATNAPCVAREKQR